MLTVPISARIASTAAPSPPFLSPRPDPAAGGHGGGLGDPDQLEGEVAVGRRPVGAGSRDSPGGTFGDGAGTRDLLSGPRRRWWRSGESCPAILGA